MAEEDFGYLFNFVPPSVLRKEAVLHNRLIQRILDNDDLDLDEENEGDSDEVNSSKVH